MTTVTNPLKFIYDNESGRISFETNFAESQRVRDPEVGDILFKMTVRIYLRTHDGYCSYFDFVGEDDMDDCKYVTKETELISLYFRIPDEFKDRIDEVVKDGDLIENEETEAFFVEWMYHSDCDGSGYCELMDNYQPIKIEYVEIV